MIEATLEDALAGRICAASAPTEAHFHDHWHAGRLGHHQPVAGALHGGLLADRLPWVFAAGYQAAIRAVFADAPKEGWIAFCAAEDGENPAERPGVSASQNAGGEWRISGNKIWIGGSRHVRHLFVTARNGGSDTPDVVVRVRRDDPGLALTHRDAPGFLGEFSQGFAAFENALCSVPEAWPRERAREFGLLEARFVMLAGVGFLMGQAGEEAERRLLAPLALALAEACRGDVVGVRTMAALDLAFQDARERFEANADLSLWPRWEADRRLLTMYSDRIQRRAQRAATD